MFQPDLPATIRFLTWNIHRGVGPDRKCDLARVVAIVRRQAPDIVALQEVDSRRAWGNAGAFDVLRREFGPHGAEAKAIQTAEGDYGHVLLSRWPLHDVVIHDLSVAKREPRLAIDARVMTEAGPLRMITAHCGLFPAERRHQGAILAGLARAATGAVVIAGDFNDWARRGSATRALSREMPGRTQHRTFPARLPLGQLDRIYCRPGSALVRSWTDPEARVASDHLPLIADLAVTP
jgi:endonuclease/exonuclease/phosphatase family metal-dependent hydrolase